jgi:hypothetical protein
VLVFFFFFFLIGSLDVAGSNYRVVMVFVGGHCAQRIGYIGLSQMLSHNAAKKNVRVKNKSLFFWEDFLGICH